MCRSRWRDTYWNMERYILEYLKRSLWSNPLCMLGAGGNRQKVYIQIQVDRDIKRHQYLHRYEERELKKEREREARHADIQARTLEMHLFESLSDFSYKSQHLHPKRGPTDSLLSTKISVTTIEEGGKGEKKSSILKRSRRLRKETCRIVSKDTHESTERKRRKYKKPYHSF